MIDFESRQEADPNDGQERLISPIKQQDDEFSLDQQWKKRVLQVLSNYHPSKQKEVPIYQYKLPLPRTYTAPQERDKYKQLLVLSDARQLTSEDQNRLDTRTIATALRLTFVRKRKGGSQLLLRGRAMTSPGRGRVHQAEAALLSSGDNNGGFDALPRQRGKLDAAMATRGVSNEPIVVAGNEDLDHSTSPRYAEDFPFRITKWLCLFSVIGISVAFD